VEAFASWLVDVVQHVGYPGLFIAMFFGNALVPIPVELIMPPAGYLIQKGEWGAFGVMFSAIAGDISGSLFSYYIARHFGRRFLFKYGKYLFFTHDKIEMLDKFFAGHGEISVLTGRLVPGLRHFMAFPAGMAHMHVKKFAVYTGIGGGLWMSILVFVGYLIGGNKEMVKHYMPYVEGIIIGAVVVMIVMYMRHHRKNNPAGQTQAADKAKI
jgi:membrane protein DedA with SNARE-associated domain